LGKALFHLLDDGQADVAPVSSSMLILHASRVFNIVLEMVDLLSLFFIIIFQLRKVGFDHPGLLLRLLSLCLEIFVLGGENRELDLFLFMESYLLADLQLERLVLYLDIGERRLEVLDADCVLLQLLMVVGFHLLDEVGVHVPDVLQVVADARVHGHDYLLEGVGDDDQELFLVDLVISVVDMLALVLLDECGVGALSVAEASVYELEAASDGVVFLVRLQWSLLGPEPALLVLSCGKGSRGDVLLLRLVRHCVQRPRCVLSKLTITRRHHCHHLGEAVRIHSIHVHKVVMYVVLRPWSLLALLLLLRRALTSNHGDIAWQRISLVLVQCHLHFIDSTLCYLNLS